MSASLSWQSYVVFMSTLFKFWLNLTETSTLNQSLVCQAKCVCDSQIGILGATKWGPWCQRRGRCLLVWKASPGFFRHHKSSSGIEKQESFWSVVEKKSSVVRKSRQGREKKNTIQEVLRQRKSWTVCARRTVRGPRAWKKRSKKAIHQIATSEEKAVEKSRRKSRWKKAERFRKYWRWPNNLQRNPLLYGSLRGGAIPHRGPANYSD